MDVEAFNICAKQVEEGCKKVAERKKINEVSNTRDGLRTEVTY